MEKVLDRRPTLEVLEDRLPPGSLRSADVLASHPNKDKDVLSQVALFAPVQADQGNTAQGTANQNPGVLPVQSHAYGQTYGEWQASWWQWAYSLPVDSNPLFDNGDATQGQSGHVWFLGGTFTSNEIRPGVFEGVAERTETIPAGKALFFPIVNSEDSFLENPSLTTEEELRASANFFANAIVEDSLLVEIDGQPLENLAEHRVESPLFTYGPLPDGNLLEEFGVPGAVEGATSQGVGDGYFVMLAPLSVGEHTLHWEGTLDLTSEGGFVFTQDITYHLTVEPGAK